MIVKLSGEEPQVSIVGGRKKMLTHKPPLNHNAFFYSFLL